MTLGFYKIFVYLEAVVYETIIIVLPLPPASPTRLQHYCITIAQYATPFRPPVFTPYTIQYCALQYLVKAKVTQALAAERVNPIEQVNQTVLVLGGVTGDIIIICGIDCSQQG